MLNNFLSKQIIVLTRKKNTEKQYTLLSNRGQHSFTIIGNNK